MRLDRVWGQYPLEFDIMPFLTATNMAVVVIAISGASLFLAAIIMRFGKAGFWVIWAIYMIGCLAYLGLKKKYADMKRPYVAPLGKLGCDQDRQNHPRNQSGFCTDGFKECNPYPDRNRVVSASWGMDCMADCPETSCNGLKQR